VVAPCLASRIEQQRDLAAVGVKASQVCALAQIAIDTRSGQIIGFFRATVFARNDVVNL
jgi:hypothetical protein